MRIKLPWIDPFDTLDLPEDFEKQIKTSFAKFTSDTNPRSTWLDKMMYISYLPLYFKYGSGWRETTIAESGVKELIHDRMDYELEENDDVLDRDDIYSFEFMCDCFNAGMDEVKFMQRYESYSYSSNEETQKVMFRIMQIVMAWEPEEKNNATD